MGHDERRGDDRRRHCALIPHEAMAEGPDLGGSLRISASFCAWWPEASWASCTHIPRMVVDTLRDRAHGGRRRKGR